ncbi:MAG: 7-carboxy-7-deazaguanine synthase QueE [Flavobacteriaceae bacterium]|nr:MAG: 7-carboxy-7-deazaguanine synthase QueE [Flavobacteriaceae bacterium]
MQNQAEGEFLPIMEHFYTIQGEGFHSGKASYFIRIGGCDVGCHWCDVKESWDPKAHPLLPVDSIVDIATAHSKWIVLTGGEPTMWNLHYLTQKLKAQNCTVCMETSGAYPILGEIDWVCLSPKKNQLPIEENYPKAQELKVIIHNQNDFVFALQQAEKVSASCHLFLQPEWSKEKEMTPYIVDFVLKNPQFKISLQTHKYLNIP